MNPPTSTTILPSSTTTMSSSTAMITHSCPPHTNNPSLADCQFAKAENEILKQQLDSCKSFSSTCTSPTSTDNPSTIQTPQTHTVYIWFGFFIGFFVGCLFVIFVNSSTYKKIKNVCCHRKKTIAEREREMNNLKNKNDTRKEDKKEENKKDKKKEEKKKEENKTEKKTETKPKTEKNRQTEMNWEEKNKMKQELNKKNPPPRQKKIDHLVSLNLIDLNTKEEKIGNETNKISDEEKKIGQEEKKAMVDSVAIMIESV